MTKLTRDLFKVTGDVKYADFYERIHINEILASMNPETGMTTYFKPMGTGYFKAFGTPTNSFWCCTGTGMENFTRLGDSVYFHDDKDLWVTYYVSSTLELERPRPVPHADDGPSAHEQGDLHHHRGPDRCGQPAIQEARLDCRAARWRSRSTARRSRPPTSGGFLSVSRVWQRERQGRARLPALRAGVRLQDNQNAVAFTYGPLVLSAGLGTASMTTTAHGVHVRGDVARRPAGHHQGQQRHQSTTGWPTSRATWFKRRASSSSTSRTRIRMASSSSSPTTRATRTGTASTGSCRAPRAAHLDDGHLPRRGRGRNGRRRRVRRRRGQHRQRRCRGQERKRRRDRLRRLLEQRRRDRLRRLLEQRRCDRLRRLVEHGGAIGSGGSSSSGGATGPAARRAVAARLARAAPRAAAARPAPAAPRAAAARPAPAAPRAAAAPPASGGSLGSGGSSNGSGGSAPGDASRGSSGCSCALAESPLRHCERGLAVRLRALARLPPPASLTQDCEGPPLGAGG